MMNDCMGVSKAPWAAANECSYVKVVIDWHSYLVPSYMLPQFVEMFRNIRKLESNNEIKEIEYEIKTAPDIAYERMKASAREEVKDTLTKERDQYSRYWMDERAKTANLELANNSLAKELNEVKEKLTNIQGVITPENDESLEF